MFYHTTPDERPLTPPPCRWPALITLPTLSKFQLVWRHLCDVVLFPSCLVKHGPTDASLLIEYRFKSLELHPLLFSFVRRAEPLFLAPPCFASSLLLFLVRPLCLASSFLPCLTSSALTRFLPPSLPPPRPSFISLRVELQNNQLVCDLICI